MFPIDPRSLCPGQELITNLYNRSGVKLLSHGSVLTRDLCEAIRTTSKGPLYLASSSSQVLREMTLQASSEAQGVRIDPSAVQHAKPGSKRWRARLGVEEGLFDRQASAVPFDEVQRWTKARSLWRPREREAARLVASRRALWENLPGRVLKSVDPVKIAEPGRTGWPEGGRLAGLRDDRVQKHQRFATSLMCGQSADAQAPIALVDELIDLFAGYPDRFAQLALLAPRRMDYLPDHGYTTAALSVCIAGGLGWSRANVRLAGLAGLLCDVGMALTPLEMRASQRPLDDVTLNSMRRHPLLSVMMLDTVTNLPEPVSMAAHQHHERLDGSGYPSAARGEAVCDLARVVAVADVFAAATEPRPYKPSKLPHDAIVELIRLGESGVMDRNMVRALVRGAGLFPVGSYVHLSSQRRAVVVGVNAEAPDRPSVRLIESQERGDVSLGETIDLASLEAGVLRVVRAVEPPVTMIGV